MPGDWTQIQKASGCVAGDRRSGQNTVAASEVTILAAPGASKRLVVTSLIVGNKNATAAVLTFRDGTGGTMVFELPVGASMNGTSYRIRPPLQLSANTAFTAQGSAACSAAVFASGWVENA